MASNARLLIAGLAGLALAAALWPYPVLGLATFLVVPAALVALALGAVRHRGAQCSQPEAAAGLCLAMIAVIALTWTSIRAIELVAAGAWRQSHPSATVPPLASPGDWTRIGIASLVAAAVFALGLRFRGRQTLLVALLWLGAGLLVIPAALVLFHFIGAAWPLGN